METPLKADSPASVGTPYTKKSKTPEKLTPEKEKAAVELPVHYKRFVDDLRILDEALSIFRVKNQIPFFSYLRDNIERVSGRRFTIDHFRQLMMATGGDLFKVEWQEMKDVEGKPLKLDLTVRAIDHEKDGVEIFKRMTTDQAAARKSTVENYLTSRLEDYMSKNPDNTPENAYPIKPFDLPTKLDVGSSDSPHQLRLRVETECCQNAIQWHPMVL